MENKEKKGPGGQTPGHNTNSNANSATPAGGSQGSTGIPVADDAHSVARKMLAAGLCVVPRNQGAKRPALHEWNNYQKQLPTEGEIDAWFAGGAHKALGIICGAVSGGLEVIDIDLKADPTGAIVTEAETAIKAYCPGLWERMPREQSPSGGLHLYFRSPTPKGNAKLAHPESGKEALVETRGEGGFIVCAPTPGYTMLAGDLTEVPILTEDEREGLIESMRSLDRSLATVPKESRSNASSSYELTPLDDYNNRPDAVSRTLAVLEKHGWVPLGRDSRGGMRLRRPGKDWGISAVLGADGRQSLKVFSSSTPFGLDGTHSPAAVLAVLEFSGDFSACARALRIMGYGDKGTVTGDPETTSDLESMSLATDLDASIRLIERHGSEIRYCKELGWLVWDGKRWVKSEAAVLQRAKETARAWFNHANNIENELERKAAVSKALQLESAAHISGAVKLATSDPRIYIEASALDSDHLLLNVQNGTLDLRSGELRPHRREDLITKIANAEYDPGATHPALETLLGTIGADWADVPAFLARCFGACLTGDVSTESLFLLQGDGGSGKTTLTEGFSSMMNDYAAKLPFEAFCLHKHGRGTGPTPERAMLRGARFAFAAEGDQAARLDAGEVKQLTGGESVTARELYHGLFTFPPTWKLWLVSNYAPRCDADDSGLWRRFVKIWFPQVPLEKRDPRIKEALVGDPGARAAILAWAVKGCLEWQSRGRGRNGLAIPESVQRQTDEYRNSQDTIADWIADIVADGGAVDPHAWTSSKLVREHYENWCADNGCHALGQQRLAESLKHHGLAPQKLKGARGWKGVRLPKDQRAAA